MEQEQEKEPLDKIDVMHLLNKLDYALSVSNTHAWTGGYMFERFVRDGAWKEFHTARDALGVSQDACKRMRFDQDSNRRWQARNFLSERIADGADPAWYVFNEIEDLPGLTDKDCQEIAINFPFTWQQIRNWFPVHEPS
jgi:hypothetical protein